MSSSKSNAINTPASIDSVEQTTVNNSPPVTPVAASSSVGDDSPVVLTVTSHEGTPALGPSSSTLIAASGGKGATTTTTKSKFAVSDTRSGARLLVGDHQPSHGFAGGPPPLSLGPSSSSSSSPHRVEYGADDGDGGGTAMNNSSGGGMGSRQPSSSGRRAGSDVNNNMPPPPFYSENGPRASNGLAAPPSHPSMSSSSSSPMLSASPPILKRYSSYHIHAPLSYVGASTATTTAAHHQYLSVGGGGGDNNSRLRASYNGPSSVANGAGGGGFGSSYNANHLRASYSGGGAPMGFVGSVSRQVTFSPQMAPAAGGGFNNSTPPISPLMAPADAGGGGREGSANGNTRNDGAVAAFLQGVSAVAASAEISLSGGDLNATTAMNSNSVNPSSFSFRRAVTFQSIGNGKYLPTAEAIARSDQKRGKGAIVGGVNPLQAVGGGGGATVGSYGVDHYGSSPIAVGGGGGVADDQRSSMATVDPIITIGGGSVRASNQQQQQSQQHQQYYVNPRASGASYFDNNGSIATVGSYVMGGGGGGLSGCAPTNPYFGGNPSTLSTTRQTLPMTDANNNNYSNNYNDDGTSPSTRGSRLNTATEEEHPDELYSDDSVESDFDYDDDGKPRTYYRKPKKSTLTEAAATKILAESTHAASYGGGGGGFGSTIGSFFRKRGGGPSSSSKMELRAHLLPTGGGKKGSTLTGHRASAYEDDDLDSVGGAAGGGLGATAPNARSLPLNMFYDKTAASRVSLKMRMLSMLTDRSPSVLELPENLRGLGKQIHKLNTEDLLYISSMVSRKAHREAFSVLQYSGKAWYLPSIRRVKPELGETRDWDWPHYNSAEGLILTLGGRRLTLQIGGYIVRAIAFAMFWLVIWAALPQELAEPQGYIFDPLITFVLSAIVGGFICRVLQIPPLVGVLWVAIIYNNIPSYNTLTAGIIPEVKVIASRLGLTVVLLRAGFSTSWKAMRPLWKNVATIAIVALLLEGGVHTAMAYYLMDYGSWTWASLQGFMCAVPSAAIIVPSSLLLQSEGLSKTSGPLPLMLSTVGVETVLGVWLSSFINGLAVGGASLGMSMAMGPVQIVGGLVIGIVLAYAFVFTVHCLKNEAKRMPNGEYSEDHLEHVTQFSLVVFLLTAFAAVFFGYKYNLGGGACVTVMMFSTMTAHLWIKDGDPELMEQKRALGSGLCSAWELLIMPFLFSMTGTKVNLKMIFNADVFPKGLLLWVASVSTRMLVVFCSTAGLKFSLKEKIYACGSWAAKATVQSALAGVALTTMNQKIADTDPTDPSYPSLLADQERAQKVQNIAILFVILSAPTAATWMIKLGPRVLPKDD